MIIVSKHAQQRFLERYCGMDHAASRMPAYTKWAEARIRAFWEAKALHLRECTDPPEWMAPRAEGQRVLHDPDSDHFFLVADEEGNVDRQYTKIITYSSAATELAPADEGVHFAFVMGREFACPIVIRLLGREHVSQVATDHSSEEVRRRAKAVLRHWTGIDVQTYVASCPSNCVATVAPCGSALFTSVAGEPA